MKLKVSKNVELGVNEKIKLYHVTMDLGVGSKIFTPRVPKNVCKGENSDIKRVCVAKSIEDAISAFPYKNYIVNDYKTENRFLSVYEIEADEKDVIFSEDLHEYVPDSHLTNECWITKEVKGIGRLIRIKDIKLSRYNRYANYYSGRVSVLEYEEIEDLYGSKVSLIVPTKEEYKELVALMDTYNMEYNVLESGVNQFYKSIDGYHAGMTDEVYSWWNLEITIPDAFDSFEFWNLFVKIDKNYLDIPGDYCKTGYDIEDDIEYDVI